jgi:drug/metabolite transporter (DMT)-like permease
MLPIHMEHNTAKKRAVLFAFGAAVLFGMQAPFSKILVNELETLFLAALLYLGAGIGMMFVMTIDRQINRGRTEKSLDVKDTPFVILMVILDMIAPILLLFGLRMSSAGTASLLGNFEIVATSVLAMVFFREKVGRRLWIAIALITIASMLLSLGGVSDDGHRVRFSFYWPVFPGVWKTTAQEYYPARILFRSW